MNEFIIAYILYVITSTIIDAYSLEIIIKGIRAGFLILLTSYIMTSIYFIVLTLNYVILSIIIIIYLILIPIILFNLNRIKLSSIILLLSNEILMSLLYFVIIYNGNLPLVFSTLYRYSTNLQSFGSSLTEQLIFSLLEIPNSFMFFLMIYPEILYITLKTRQLFSLALSSLALIGPNVASDMTHAILPIPYEPFRESSILVGIYSVFISIYYYNKYILNKLSSFKFYILLIFNLLLSISSYIYSIYTNKILYGFITYLVLIFSILICYYNLNLNKIRYIEFFITLPQLFWGLSIAYFLIIPYFSTTIAISFFISTLISILILRRNS